MRRASPTPTSGRTTPRSAFPTGRPKSPAIKAFAVAGKKTAVISTINGDANVPFYKELANEGVKATDIPSIGFSMGEEELAGIDTKNLVGHLAGWAYFQSVKTPENKAFIDKWHAYTKDPKRVTNDPMELEYILFHMWAHAVEQAGTADVDAVRQAMIGQSFKAPSGFIEVMQPNHHLTKAGHGRRDPGQRAVQHRLPEQDRAAARAVEQISRRGQGQGRRLVLPLGLRQLHQRQVRRFLSATAQLDG